MAILEAWTLDRATIQGLGPIPEPLVGTNTTTVSFCLSCTKQTEAITAYLAHHTGLQGHLLCSRAESRRPWDAPNTAADDVVAFFPVHLTFLVLWAPKRTT